ncbi:reverse transcriptase domain-containing protein [Tanacetum coccineum]
MLQSINDKLEKKMTDKYCPRGEMKKLEVELWDLKVKGTDVIGYNQCFQELALMCVRMFPEESDKIERYVDGFGPGNVIPTRSAPKCHKCNRVGHLARDCRSPTNANTANNQRGTGQVRNLLAVSVEPRNISRGSVRS